MFSATNTTGEIKLRISNEIMYRMLHNLRDFDPADIIWIFVSPSRASGHLQIQMSPHTLANHCRRISIISSSACYVLVVLVRVVIPSQMFPLRVKPSGV